MRDKEKEMGCAELIGLLLMTIFGIAARAWALSVLWSWFIVTRFTAPMLGVVDMLGVTLVIGMMRPGSTVPIGKKDERTSRERWAEAVGRDVFVPLFAMAIGWLYRVLG